MRIRRYLSVLLVFILTTVGCGNGSSTEPGSSTGPGHDGSDSGSFEISYTGDASGTISGPAFFGDIENQTGVFFSVFGAEAGEEDLFALVSVGRRPGTGTYDIVHSVTAEGEFLLTVFENTKALTTQSTGGTLTVEGSTPDRVQGSFEATLAGGMSGSGVTLSATGSFDAVSCEDNVEDCDKAGIIPAP